MESPNFDPKWYYERLSEFWKQQDAAFWNSARTYLLFESILMGAAGLMLSSDRISNLWQFVLVLSIAGIASSVLWYGIAARLTRALRLTSHQARHLEMEIFAERLPRFLEASDATLSFPMFFWGSYTIMRDYSARDPDLLLEGFARRIGDHVIHHQQQLDSQRGIRSFSAYGATSKGMPIVFALSWFLIGIFAALSYWGLHQTVLAIVFFMFIVGAFNSVSGDT